MFSRESTDDEIADGESEEEDQMLERVDAVIEGLEEIGVYERV